MGVGALGGYALPERFDAAIRQVQAEDAIVRPRCTVLPATDPPDSRLTFPTLDQTSQQGIYAGVQVTHGGEGTTLTETTAHLRQMSLEPKALGAYCVVSDKLLHNWSTCGAFITRQLAMAMSGQEDVDCLTGDGVNKSRGVLVSPAAISYSRATPNKIGFGDVLGMAARLLTRGGSPVWVANPTTIPELGAMTDSGSHAVWSGSRADALGGAAQKLPSTLLGFPVLFSTRVPPLGSRGDLSLLDLSFYLLLNGSGPFVASSEHVYFLSNRTVFRINWNFDGGSWLSEPIGMEADASQTTSPFIVLS
jgi:HK97 family phage major capsid protein